MHLILFGFKGSGKTHFGRLAAKQLKKEFLDLDDLTQSCGPHHTQCIRQIYQNIGETAFRELEAKAAKSIQVQSNTIIAVGGGTFTTHYLIDFFQQMGPLIYLETSFTTIQQRILKDGLPSFIDKKNPLKSLFEIYQQRKLLYESIPAYRINTDALDEASILSKICSLWSSYGL